MRGALVLALVGLAVVACSSPSSIPATPDGSAAAQSPGGPCDPTAAVPCYPSGDPCVIVVCDPVEHVCRQSDVDDGGPQCSSSVPCTSTADCATGLTCGFPVSGGCSAVGTCIDIPDVCQDEDSGSCAGGAPVCGCNGQPDPLVVTGYATSPVASLTACPDGGPVIEAGAADASDAASE